MKDHFAPFADRIPETLADRAFTRRQTLRGAGSLAVAAAPVSACLAAERPASVPDYRRPGERDDIAAAKRALAAGGDLYFPAGRGSAPDGAYLLDALSLRSGISVFGDGAKSVLRTAGGDVRSVVSVMSETLDQPLVRLAIRDLRIEGRVTETGFREHWNLVSLSGVSGVRIERVQFVGFAGDGLYLGAEKAWPKREPRQIRDVLISECMFDGLNNDNRNGISVTGGSDITIDRCRFTRCTRPNMPGPIDFEPDDFSFYRLARVKVTNCEFLDCGGNLGQIGFMIPASVPPPQDLLISGNVFRSYRGTGGDVFLAIRREATAQTPSMNVRIERNLGLDGYSGVQLFSGKGIVVRGNRWRNYASRCVIGFDAADAGVQDVTVSDRFERCGSREGNALSVYKGGNIRLERNVFVDTGHDGPGSAPIYIGTGRIRGLALIGNDFRRNPRAWGLVTVERNADLPQGATRMADNLVPDGKSLPDL